MTSVEWKAVAASVSGFAHQAEGLPCQDAHAVTTPANGWLLGVVSDGAGSAPRSSEGSQALCSGIVEFVTPILHSLEPGYEPDEATVRAWVCEAVRDVRDGLATKADGESIECFHATLVGVLAGPKGGWFFHIGDGAACATDADEFSPVVLSLPENGEFANETFFFTQADWQDHLRLTPFDAKFNLVVLMSDGTTPFALEAGATGPYSPFFAPVTRFLAANPSNEGMRALIDTLQRDAIRRITGDDKTLVWALKKESENSGG